MTFQSRNSDKKMAASTPPSIVFLPIINTRIPVRDNTSLPKQSSKPKEFTTRNQHKLVNTSFGKPQSKKDIIQSIETKESKIFFHYAIHLEVENTEDGVAISYLPLNIHTWGESYDVALEDFTREVQYTYFRYKDKSDEDLTQYAKAIKYGIIALVKEVCRG